MAYETVGTSARYAHEVLVGDNHLIVDCKFDPASAAVVLWEAVGLEGTAGATYGMWKKLASCTSVVGRGVVMRAFDPSSTDQYAPVVLSGAVVGTLVTNHPAGYLDSGVYAQGYTFGLLTFVLAAKP